MKNTYLAILLMAFSIGINAQDLANKIPKNIRVVVNIKGKNVTDLMSLSEFSNSKLGTVLNKELAKETDGQVENLEELGVNINENFYYFLDIKDKVMYNVFMIPFKNTSKISSLFNPDYDEIIKEGNLSYLQGSYDSTVTMWNNNTLVFVIPSDLNEYDDYGYNDYYSDDIAVEINEPERAIDVAEEAVEVIEIEVEEVEEVVEDVQIEVIEAEEVVEDVVEDVVEEATEGGAVAYDEETEEYVYYKPQPEDNATKKRRIEREKRQEARRNNLGKNTLDYAIKLLNKTPVTSILDNAKYRKALGKGNHEMFVWMDDFADLYLNSLPTGMLGLSNPYQFLNIKELYTDMTLVGKLNFEEEKAIMTVDYTMNDKMADLYRPIYNGKFNSDFLKYINEDKMLGYVNVNMSTEGILEAYPDIIRNAFTDKTYDNNRDVQNIANITNVASQLFTLLIDEEGASKIIRGDMLLLLTDLREREITYTDYEYDEDYNYTEIEKTKTENVPDFLFLFTSEQERMFHSIMKIGMSEGEVTYENGIYQVNTAGSIPFDMYCMFKNNTVFMGSSVEHLTQVKNGTYPAKVSSQMKKDLAKNASSFYVNGKSILSKVPSEAFPRSFRNDIDYIINNTENLKLNFSRVKGNTMSGEMILETPTQGHKNSFAYFINVIDQLMD